MHTLGTVLGAYYEVVSETKMFALRKFIGKSGAEVKPIKHN
jgi:hypothetical protein